MADDFVGLVAGDILRHAIIQGDAIQDRVSIVEINGSTDMLLDESTKSYMSHHALIAFDHQRQDRYIVYHNPGTGQ